MVTQLAWCQVCQAAQSGVLILHLESAAQVVSIDGAIAAAATEMVDDIRRRNAQSAAIADAAAAAGPAQPPSAQPVRCLCLLVANFKPHNHLQL